MSDNALALAETDAPDTDAPDTDAPDTDADEAMPAASSDEAAPTTAEGEGGADAPAKRKDMVRVVEALLFASREPLSDAVIASHLPTGTDVAEILGDLEDAYRDCGVNLVRIANGWALRTAPDLAGVLRRETEVRRRLSRAALETLAIVAYHQPVTRAEIEQIRAVAVSKGTLDLLFEQGWIQPRGRRRTPGRPATWVTTPAFLDHFGLASLDDLPGVDELRAAGLLDARATPAVSALGLSDDAETDDADDTGDHDTDDAWDDDPLTDEGGEGLDPTA